MKEGRGWKEGWGGEDLFQERWRPLGHPLAKLNERRLCCDCFEIALQLRTVVIYSGGEGVGRRLHHSL